MINNESYPKFIFIFIMELMLLVVSYILSINLISILIMPEYANLYFDMVYGVILSKSIIILLSSKYSIKSKKIYYRLGSVVLFDVIIFTALYFIDIFYIFQFIMCNFAMDIIFISCLYSIEFLLPWNKNWHISERKKESPIHKIDNWDIPRLMVDSLGNYFLVILKRADNHLLDKINSVLPNANIINISSLEKDELQLKNSIESNTIDAVGIYTANITRVEFFRIFEYLKDLPVYVYLINDNFDIKKMEKIQDIIDNFPLEEFQIETKFKNEEVIILYMGCLTESLVNTLLQEQVKSIIVIDKDIFISKLEFEYKSNKNIKVYPEKYIDEIITRKYDRIIFSLPVSDLNYCENHKDSAIEKNTSFAKKILSLVHRNKQNINIMFVSSTMAGDKTTAFAQCCHIVEQMIINYKTENKYINLIRIPRGVYKDNLLRTMDFNNKVIEVDIEYVFCSPVNEDELAGFIIQGFNYKEPVSVNIVQLYLPEFINDLNFKGNREEKISILINNQTYPIEYYM